MGNYLRNSITVLLIISGVILLSQFTAYKIPINWQMVVIGLVMALVLGLLATWLEKYGWW
jgi:hypothetical protein